MKHPIPKITRLRRVKQAFETVDRYRPLFMYSQKIAGRASVVTLAHLITDRKIENPQLRILPNNAL
jgi:hypothetical protein